MKFVPGILLWTAVACAADFTNGQAARAVIGQQTFTAADPNSSNTIIGAAGGIAYAADTLFVADDNRMGAAPENNRVLLFQNLASMLPAPMANLAYTTKCPVCVGQASIVLGQPDFSTTTMPLTTIKNNLRQPTAVASDGVRLVVADTNHNRVLIWNHIPTTNNTPADVVVGQPNFTTSTVPTNYTPTAKSMSGPQGVWIQNGKLFVADTQNNRVLIYNNIPAANGVAADVVLGQPSFTTPVQVNITQQGNCTEDSTSACTATAANMLNPVSVTSDSTHVFVTDLGYNRILIWNSIPTKNGALADVEIGQPNMNSGTPNFAYSVSSPASLATATTTTTVQTAALCTVSNGTDSNGNPTYPNVCKYTLNFPRFALSDGTRLFVADGGNDRVLEYLTIPTQNAAGADTILGQIGGNVDQATDASDSMNTPTSLAFDGTNLYVADPFNRRITVYTVAPNILAYQAVVNTANPNIYATGTVTIAGTINNGDIVTITINSTQYAYTVKATDAITDVIAALVAEINAGSGDPNVIAIEDGADSQVKLQARLPGPEGDNTTYAATVSTNAKIAATAADSSLNGGGNAASVAPGTIVSINGTNLSSQTAAADLTRPTLPTTLGGVQVYFDGVAAPLTYVSPTQIRAQIPWEFTSTTSVNAYVVSQMNGRTTFTSPVAVTMVSANPGVYGVLGTANPEIGIAMHYSSYATAIVSVDGSIDAGDVATVTVRSRSYNYTVQSTDTLDTVRDALVSQLRQDPEVTATPAGVFDRIIITALVGGPDGEGIPIAASASSGAGITVTAFDSQTCCSNIAGAMVTQDNPAQAGELITVITTGMGLPVLNSANQQYIVTGAQYPIGAPITAPQQFVNALAGGSTADVIQATLMPGTVGLFQVVLHLSPGLSTNTETSLTVAQGAYVSNPVSIPVVSTSSFTSGAAATPTSTPVVPTPQSTANINAVINGASFQTGFASATWVSIFGTNLSQTTQTWQNSDFVGNSLPTSLSGLSVTINGLNAYVQYVSPTQINVLAPDDTTLGPVLVQVTTAAGNSNTFTAQKNPVAPALFSMSGTYVAALHADYSFVGKTGLIAGVNSSPAKPGETILIYGTGFGPTNPALPSSQLVTTPAVLANAVRVSIGGVDAPVAYAGLVGPGLYQINATVPNVPDGDATVAAQIGGLQTQPQVSITIQH